MAASSNDLKPILTYLNRLKKNNNKTWFDAHRGEYDDARGLFEHFIDQMIDALLVTDGARHVTAKECLFRINRDVRFSKDKTPYKTSFSAVVGNGGRKETDHGYYVAIEPGGQSILAAGLYQPTAGQLAAFRNAIDRDAEPFKRLTRTRVFKEYFGEIYGARLKTRPKGYDADHPEIELLKLKQVTVFHRLSDDDVVRPDFLRHAIKVCRAMDPFLKYLEEAMKHA